MNLSLSLNVHVYDASIVALPFHPMPFHIPSIRGTFPQPSMSCKLLSPISDNFHVPIQEANIPAHPHPPPPRPEYCLDLTFMYALLWMGYEFGGTLPVPSSFDSSLLQAHLARKSYRRQQTRPCSCLSWYYEGYVHICWLRLSIYGPFMAQPSMCFMSGVQIVYFYYHLSWSSFSAVVG